jgi:hypothetical protein
LKMLALEMIHLEILAIFSLHFTLKQAGNETLQHNPFLYLKRNK